MPKVTAADLQELFDIVADIKPVRLNFCLSAAERTLRKLVTNAVYDATTPATQVEGLKFAEAHFAVSHLLLNTGLRIRRSGLIKKEQASSGDGVSNSAQFEFYTPEEIKQLREEFYEAGEKSAIEFQPTQTLKPKNTSVLIRGGWAR